MTADVTDPRLPAAIDLIGRTGAESFTVRYSDDEEPTIWMAVADYGDGRHEVDAALDPVGAALRLAERLIDGGECQHCQRPSGLSLDIDPMPLPDFVCWWQWDPELSTFRRGCEDGDRGWAAEMDDGVRRTSWSLVIAGPRCRKWGFYLPTGYMAEAEYDATVRAERRDLWSDQGTDRRPW